VHPTTLYPATIYSAIPKLGFDRDLAPAGLPKNELGNIAFVSAPDQRSERVSHVVGQSARAVFPVSQSPPYSFLLSR